MIAALIHLRNSSVRSLASSKPHLMRRAEGAELKTFNICDNLQPRRDRHVGIGSRSFASRLGVTSYLRRCRRASARSMSYSMRRRTSSLIASSLRNPMTVSRSVSNASRASCSKSREYIGGCFLHAWSLWPQLKSPRTRVQVIALVRPLGMPGAFDRAPLR